MSIKKQIDRFWNTFLLEKRNLEKALDQGDVEELQEIHKILSIYYEEFTNSKIEFTKEDDMYEVTFFAGFDKNIQIINGMLKKQAPEVVKEDWIINAFVPPLSENLLHSTIQIGEISFGAYDFIVYYQVNELVQMVDIQMYCEKLNGLEENEAREIAIYYVQSILGECFFEAYVNTLAVTQVIPEENHVNLPDFYEELIEVIEKYEWKTYTDPTSIYRVYKLDEAEISNTVRQDMKLIFTIHPQLIQDSLMNQTMQAMSFYDLGGEFGYLYYKNLYHSQTDATLRQKLATKFDTLLGDAGIARSIGGAIGNTYSYIDLAIFDKDAFNVALTKFNDLLSIELQYVSFFDEQDA